MRVLIVDDDIQLCSIMKRGLQEESYAVDCVHDGEEGVLFAETAVYDLIVLDIMMPKMNGLDVCRTLRRKEINTPVLMLTAKDTVDDRVTGLDTGADDYLVKPFAFPELLARIRAILRRESEGKSPTRKAGELELNTITREVTWKGKDVELTNKEFAILDFLMSRPNAVVTRTMIEDHAWDYDLDAMSNLVDVYIRRIRQKIDPVDGKKIIQTVRGAGYQLKEL